MTRWRVVCPQCDDYELIVTTDRDQQATREVAGGVLWSHIQTHHRTPEMEREAAVRRLQPW